MNSSDDDDGIGNKRPPKHTQFKPGVSGNPKGRPKGSVNLRTRVARHLRRTAIVTRNGRSKKILIGELIALQITDAAAKGDLKAAMLAMRVDDEAALVTSKSSTDSFELPNEDNLRFILRRLRGLVGEDE